MKNITTQKGFALPTVIMTSLALFILGFAILQSVMSLRESALSNYYYKIAEEAAEAGVTYATACLENNQRNQTWGPTDYNGVSKPSLKQNTTCDGTTTSSVTSVLVADDDSIKTEFEVSNLDIISENATQVNSVQISAKGYAKVKSAANGVSKTYEATIKKSVVWNADFVAEKSASGITRTCGVLSGSVYCWGTNHYGQLGNGTDGGGNGTINASLIPVKVKRETYPAGIGTKKVIDLVAGGYTNCVLIEGGEVYCWGQNNKGQLGNGTITDSNVPIRTDGALIGKNVIKLGVGGSTFCALIDNGDLYCWGANSDGQVGNGTVSTSITSPTLIAGPSKTTGGGNIGSNLVSDITNTGAFNNHLCAISLGKLYCWGSNGDGQLGTNDTTYRSVPTAVSTSSAQGSQLTSSMTVTAVAGDGNTGDGHTCAIAYTTTPNDMQAFCWGSHRLGFKGNGDAYGTVSLVPKKVNVTGALKDYIITEVAVNDVGACVIAYHNTVTIDSTEAFCWGAAASRGDGINARTNVPVKVKDQNDVFLNSKVSNIIGGAQRFCALANNKSYCWGTNGSGQIGDGTTVSPRRQPTEALFLRPKNNEYIY